MKGKYKLKRSCLFVIIAILICKPVLAMEDSSIELLVTKELATLNQRMKTDVSIHFTNSGKTRDNFSENKIYINIRELEEKIIGRNEKKRLNIIRLILAHEIAHIVQQKTYSELDHDEISNHVHRIFEAQADIISSIYVNQILIEKEINKSSYLNNFIDLKEVNFELGILSYLLGSNSDTLQTHPNSDRRFLSYKIGQKYAIANFFKKTIEDNKDKSDFPLSQIQELYKFFLISSNLPPQEFVDNDLPMNWSLRQARRVNHDSLSLLKNIILSYDINELKPNSDGFIYFALNFKNDNNIPIFLDFEVRIDCADKLNNGALRDLGVTLNYIERLNVNEKKQIFGKLPSIRCPGNEQIPQLILPDSPLSLLSAYPLEIEQNIPISNYGLNINLNDNNNGMDLYGLISKITGQNSLKSNFESNIVGIGRQLYDNDGLNEFIEYTCFSEFSNIYLYKYPNKRLISYSSDNFISYELALTNYNNLISLIKQKLSKDLQVYKKSNFKLIQENVLLNDDLITDLTYSSTSKIVNIRIKFNKKSKNINIGFELIT